MKPWKDPIVEEVRAARQAYAAKFNFDLKAIAADLRKLSRELRKSGEYRFKPLSEAEKPPTPKKAATTRIKRAASSSKPVKPATIAKPRPAPAKRRPAV